MIVTKHKSFKVRQLSFSIDFKPQITKIQILAKVHKLKAKQSKEVRVLHQMKLVKLPTTLFSKRAYLTKIYNILMKIQIVKMMK